MPKRSHKVLPFGEKASTYKKNTVYTGFGIIVSFRHALGVSQCVNKGNCITIKG